VPALPRAKKRFGQHFLTDRHYVERIVQAIAPRADDAMVEIGPGTGILTRPLSSHVDHLHVVEIDRDLAAALRDEFPPEKLTVHQGDALEFDFGALPAPLRVVGNLPYNVSTPILFSMAAIAERLRDCTFMLQKEVVERMVAEPATADYGRLSVMLQYRFEMALALRVPPGAFTPPPKVDSAVVRMRPLGAARARARHDAREERVVPGARAAPQDAAKRGARPGGARSFRCGRHRRDAARRDALGGRIHRAGRRGRRYARWMNSIL